MQRIPLVIGVGLLLAACGSAGGPTVAGQSGTGANPKPTASLSANQLYLQFAACLRQHGANEPDPMFDAKGNPQWQVKIDSIPVAQKQPCMTILQEAFQQRGQGQVNAPLTAAQLAQVHQFVLCMRKNGQPTFPDIDPQTRNFPGVNEQDPQVQQSYQACKSELPQGAG